MNTPDLQHAVRLADRVWWVGQHLPDEELQCHTYLIEQGDQSVLFDPGSRLTIDSTLGKIEEVMPFSQIRWIVCHHQDPDITGCLPQLDELITRDDARIVSHWRGEALIKHYAISTPFWLIEEHDWKLPLEDRLLRFVFTPYAHFPGAFCTFDSTSGVLFSSDLFGGFNAEPSLYARDEDYFEAIRPFHEHYIPSREVLNHALARVEEHPIEMIAPQHGCIIEKRLVGPIISKLKSLECGLYMMAEKGTDVRRLSRLNGTLKDITSTMVISRDFREIADRLLEILRRMLPANSIEFYVQLEDDTVLHLAPETRYRGVAASLPGPISIVFGINQEEWSHNETGCFRLLQGVTESTERHGDQLLLPLFRGDEEWSYGVVVITLESAFVMDEDVGRMMDQMSAALQVAVERETIYRGIELERQKFYERSIRDPLTGLFTRFYMEDTLRRLFEIHDRNAGTPVSLAMLDIDHFKKVNDRFGHLHGDNVLCRVAHIIQADARAGDLPVRLGGEEFALIVVGEPAVEIPAIAERLRQRVAAIRFTGTLADLQVTVSVGTAIRQMGESIPGLIERADLALYRAKNTGRNRVCSAETPGRDSQWTFNF